MFDQDGYKEQICPNCGERNSEIIPRLIDIANAKVKIAAQTYTVKKLTPAPKVVLDDKTLKVTQTKAQKAKTVKLSAVKKKAQAIAFKNVAKLTGNKKLFHKR